VYWYCAFPMRPPARTSCVAWKKVGAPGTTATRPRSLVITWSALTLRSASGFSMTNSRAVLVAVLGPLPWAPVNPTTFATAGSCPTISTISVSLARIAWNEMSCAA
jgi:hypothetical protein